MPVRIVEQGRTTAWADRAACRNLTTDEWFPTIHEGPDDIGRAKAICASCPVRPECLAYALTHWQKVGIWGGETETERRKTRRRMQAGLNAKSVAEADALGWALDYLYPTSPEESDAALAS